MAKKSSAGLVMYRRRGDALEVFLVHPGGPFWTKKDMGAWSIPKGEFDPDEELLLAAKREFEEETGHQPSGEFVSLAAIKQPGGKTVYAWAVEGDCDAAALRSNVFSMEWPRGSGRVQEYPEVDRAAWFPLGEARGRILQGQRGFLDQLAGRLGLDKESDGKQ
jgi:predicted NUDIX family NTP pyrophosphohydrolase